MRGVRKGWRGRKEGKGREWEDEKRELGIKIKWRIVAALLWETVQWRRALERKTQTEVRYNVLPYGSLPCLQWPLDSLCFQS